MTVDGIWTAEVYGAFGWDGRGVFVLDEGRVVGGDHRQYSTGSYKISGDRFEAELTVNYYGPPRTTYGEASEKFVTSVVGSFREDVIEGTVGRPDRPEYDLQIRLTRRMDLP